MKSRVLILLFVLTQIPSFAQYQVVSSNAVYTDLTGATNIPYSTADSGYYFSTAFMFKTFDHFYANFNLQMSNPVSAGGFLDNKGFLAIYDSIGKSNVLIFQVFENFGFKSVPGITTAAAKTEGATGSRILKLQWKDLVYNNNNIQRASFQIWFHEMDGSISYHYGPNTLPPATTVNDGGYTGILAIGVAGTNTTILDEINLEGKPSAPVIYTGVSTLPTLDTIPSNGTVYTFKRTPNAIANIGASNSFKIYPNPANTTLHLSGNITPDSRITVYDNTGRLVTTATAGTLKTIDISALAAGAYSVQLSSEDKTITRQFIKN